MAEIGSTESALFNLDAIADYIALDKSMAARQGDLDADVYQFLEMARSHGWVLL